MSAKNEINGLMLAGFVGGVTEVVWIGFCTLLYQVSLGDVGSAITTTIFGSNTDGALASFLGLAIHMSLSLLLAIGFGSLVLPWVRRFSSNKYVTFTVSVLTLAVVWKINFYVLLPIWNPDFVTLLPLSITLTSKLLFGAGMGLTLLMSRRQS